MGLPHELLPYAENIYRRFPEEFIALGMPGLEESFDLRPNGTWSRRMSETPIEKTVEITMRRWHSPQLMPPQGHPWYWGSLGAVGGQLPATTPVQPWLEAKTSLHLAAAAQAASAAQAAAAGQAAAAAQVSGAAQASSLPPQASSASASAPAKEDQATTQRLMNLESALCALKPQIEALLAPVPEETAQQASPAKSDTRLAGRKFVSEPKGVATQASSADGNALRSRRNVAGLQIATSSVGKDQEHKALPHAPPAVVQLPDGDSEGQASADEPAVAANDRKKAPERQRLQVNTMRLMPSAMDPASPRSPGRYSAWT